jgi:MerR family copper efflux transcriptional regulator
LANWLGARSCRRRASAFTKRTAARSGNGYRDYPDHVLEALHLIQDAQDLGFLLGEIRAGLAQAGASPPSKGAMLEALRHKLASLDQHIEEVSLRRARIVHLIAKLEHERGGGR